MGKTNSPNKPNPDPVQAAIAEANWLLEQMDRAKKMYLWLREELGESEDINHTLAEIYAMRQEVLVQLSKLELMQELGEE
jgi:hypothetical protein